LKKETFIWSNENGMFYPLHGLEVGATGGFFHKQTGLAKEEQAKR